MNKVEVFGNLLGKIKDIVGDSFDRDTKLKSICDLLHSSVPYYNWVGFYFADVKNRILLLGPFVGEPTEHTKISFGEGICGQAAQNQAVFLVPDVSTERNYLSCSANVKSEIVIPILKNDQIVGELDIDSHFFSPFDDSDTKFLTKICEIISELF